MMGTNSEHWMEEVVDNPVLDDLPYKIETNRFRELIMSPAKNAHNHLQMLIARWLIRHASSGQTEIEWSVLTEDGVKVPDVVWIAPPTYAEHGQETPYGVAPELCVEVLSPSNSRVGLLQKTGLYFKAGAKEVWLVGPDGKRDVYHRLHGELHYLAASALFPAAPAHFAD